MNICRLGDQGTGVCARHERPRNVSVTVISGAVTVPVNSLLSANAATQVIASCGHSGSVLSFSATVTSESLGVHRMGDAGILPGGSYTMVQGSPNTPAGG